MSGPATWAIVRLSESDVEHVCGSLKREVAVEQAARLTEQLGFLGFRYAAVPEVEA